MYWGFKVGTSDTIEAAKEKGKVVGATLFLGFFLLVVSGFTYLVMRRTQKRWVTITYTVLLFITFGIFVGIAYMGTSVRGKLKRYINARIPESY